MRSRQAATFFLVVPWVTYFTGKWNYFGRKKNKRNADFLQDQSHNPRSQKETTSWLEGNEPQGQQQQYQTKRRCLEAPKKGVVSAWFPFKIAVLVLTLHYHNFTPLRLCPFKPTTRHEAVCSSKAASRVPQQDHKRQGASNFAFRDQSCHLNQTPRIQIV